MRFVDENYTTVHVGKSVATDGYNYTPSKEILYNCGDSSFNYDTKSLFIGPNYET